MPTKPNGKVNGIKRKAVKVDNAEALVPRDGTEISRSKKSSDQEIEERRVKAMHYRLRGMSLRDIAKKLDVSAATIKRDLDAAKDMSLARIRDFDKDTFVADTMNTYDDIIAEAWQEYLSAPKGTTHRLKSLDSVRNAVNDKRKALHESGVVRNEDHVTGVTVNLGVVGQWSDAVKEAAIKALISNATKTELLDPVPDQHNIIDAEYVEDESNES